MNQSPPTPAPIPASAIAGAELPPEIKAVMARHRGSLVVVHFPGLHPRHPILGKTRGGNLAGRLGRELVAARLGEHLETVRSESFRTYVFRIIDLATGIAALKCGLNRVGLVSHAQLFSLAAPGSPVIAWPLPAKQQRSRAARLSHEPQAGLEADATRRASFPMPRWVRACLQRISAGLARFAGFPVCKANGKPSLRPRPDTTSDREPLQAWQPGNSIPKPCT